MTIARSVIADQDLEGRIDDFMAKFKIGTLLNRCGMRKFRGLGRPFWFSGRCSSWPS